MPNSDQEGWWFEFGYTKVIQKKKLNNCQFLVKNIEKLNIKIVKMLLLIRKKNDTIF